MRYINHFDHETDDYLRFRPDYPKKLYEYLNKLVDLKHCAWDCGTGNGQAAIALANYFERVVATDVNLQPLTVASPSKKIYYLCCAAEKTPIKDQTIDLITIAQALHWFNLDAFYQEVRRVAKDSALIAAWCYSVGKFNSAIDEIIAKLYYDLLGKEYWPLQRQYIDEEYRTIPFPFKKLPSPTFSIEKEMNLQDLLGYLNTWSAVKEYVLRNKQNPINLVRQELEAAFGDPKMKHCFVWPLHLLVGKVSTSS